MKTKRVQRYHTILLTRQTTSGSENENVNERERGRERVGGGSEIEERNGLVHGSGRVPASTHAHTHTLISVSTHLHAYTERKVQVKCIKE